MQFSQKQLKDMAIKCTEKIRYAKSGLEYFEAPYKHLVIDNFLTLNWRIYVCNLFRSFLMRSGSMQMMPI